MQPISSRSFHTLRSTTSLLRRFSIKRRLLAAFLITSLLPVVIVALYSNVRYENSISNKLSASSNQTLGVLAQNASRELAQYESLSETIIINNSIQGGLPKFDRLTDYEKNKLQTAISEELGQQIFSLSNLSNVVIMTNAKETFFDLGFEWYPDNQLSELTQAVDQSKGNAYWTYIRSNRGANMIALTRRIYSANNLNVQLGYLMIIIDEKVFSRNTYEGVSLGKGGTIYLTNAAGMVMSSVSPDIKQGATFERQAIFDKVRAQRKDGSGQAFYAKVEGQRMLVTSTYIRSADWYLIGLIPHSFLVSELSVLRQNVVLICLLTLFLAGMLAMWIYWSISSPLRSLLHYSSQIRMGQLDTKLGPSYPDEMGRLTETIDQTVEQLKGLIYQVGSEQQAKREAELKMLQAQINPHFLFNTLNSLKWSSMMSGNETVSQGIESLSELLRNTILVKEELIPIGRELDNLLHYATIQRIRYGDSFKLHIGMADDLYDCLIPKFILQPIVENSILHAGSEDGSRVGIWVEGFREGMGMRIVIRDDGKGFATDPAIPRRTTHAKLSGIGIGNVDERIRLHFGPSYGLITSSTVGQGTQTVITLPIVTKEGSDHV